MLKWVVKKQQKKVCRFFSLMFFLLFVFFFFFCSAFVWNWSYQKKKKSMQKLRSSFRPHKKLLQEKKFIVIINKIRWKNFKEKKKERKRSRLFFFFYFLLCQRTKHCQLACDLQTFIYAIWRRFMVAYKPFYSH